MAKALDEWMNFTLTLESINPNLSTSISDSPPPPDEKLLAYVYQNEILKKDLMQVRMQCHSLQKAFDDVQLDGSALRITELEQQVVRDEFRERLRMRESHLDLLKERDSHLTLATTERD
eukprot:gene38198-50096_t